MSLRPSFLDVRGKICRGPRCIPGGALHVDAGDCWQRRRRAEGEEDGVVAAQDGRRGGGHSRGDELNEGVRRCGTWVCAVQLFDLLEVSRTYSLCLMMELERAAVAQTNPKRSEQPNATPSE